jgi:putative nucleotidyltransferase with HDIG domain
MSQSLSSVDAKKKLLSIKRLPASPRIVQEVISLWKDPNSSMREYEEAISKDPSLTAEVLKVVNSPYYGLQNRVTNLRVALSMLGLRETYRIVSNRGFYSVFRTLFSKSKLDWNLMWRHSQTTANVAHVLASKFFPSITSEAYVAGLLHDLGKLCMAQFFPEEWDELLNAFVWQKDEGLDLEEKIFGITHAEMGAVLLIRWNIPKEIVLPVRYHHDPFAVTDMQDLVNIVYFAEKISTYLLTPEQQAMINEYFVENEIWHKMCKQYGELNLLENRTLFEEMKKMILQEM